jgi:hypothetical protein
VIWAALRAAIYGGLTMAEAVADTYDRGKRLARVFFGSSPRPSAPAALTYRDVSHQQSQIRAATKRPTQAPRPPRG